LQNPKGSLGLGRLLQKVAILGSVVSLAIAAVSANLLAPS